jgi:hypothetical protein
MLMFISFLSAYVGVSILGFTLYILISLIRGTSPWDAIEISENLSYQITNRWLPLLNLLVWFTTAWYCFSNIDASWFNVLKISLIWFVSAVIVDYVAFVLIKHPLSADHRGFYLGQGIWIYLTYLSVFISPVLYKLFIA